jgi:hypothetical protein
LHFILLQFITAEDDQLFGFKPIEDCLNELLPERSCPTGDEDGFVVEHFLDY